ncbi:MAG TPA: peptidylprolyl isomerase [Phycisphaerae bacterium]|nr:peptidylprolyl isomerase [Phycisphaerae bacterium]
MRCLRQIAVLLATCGLLAGCEGLSVKPSSRAPAADARWPERDERPGEQPAPPAGGPVMAMVNGQPIYMSQLHDVLLRGHGLEIAQQLVATELVRQELGRGKLAVTEAEVLAENDRTLSAMYGEGFEGSRREELLETFLLRERISREHWDLMVRRNAMLRKLAEPRVRVTDADVKEEFGEQFGRKVEVRHIQTESLTQAQMILNELKDKGTDFAELARKYSRNQTAKRGGLLPPIGRRGPTEIPPAMRQAAWAMRKVGEISDPVQVGTVFHILKLEKIIEPESADFDAAKEKLRASLHERRVRMLAQQILRELTANAKIQYVHFMLRQQSQQEAAK